MTENKTYILISIVSQRSVIRWALRPRLTLLSTGIWLRLWHIVLVVCALSALPDLQGHLYSSVSSVVFRWLLYSLRVSEGPSSLFELCNISARPVPCCFLALWKTGLFRHLCTLVTEQCFRNSYNMVGTKKGYYSHINCILLACILLACMYLGIEPFSSFFVVIQQAWMA